MDVENLYRWLGLDDAYIEFWCDASPINNKTGDEMGPVHAVAQVSSEESPSNYDKGVGKYYEYRDPHLDCGAYERGNCDVPNIINIATNSQRDEGAFATSNKFEIAEDEDNDRKFCRQFLKNIKLDSHEDSANEEKHGSLSGGADHHGSLSGGAVHHGSLSEGAELIKEITEDGGHDERFYEQFTKNIELDLHEGSASKKKREEDDPPDKDYSEKEEEYADPVLRDKPPDRKRAKADSSARSVEAESFGGNFVKAEPSESDFVKADSPVGNLVKADSPVGNLVRADSSARSVVKAFIEALYAAAAAKKAAEEAAAASENAVEGSIEASEMGKDEASVAKNEEDLKLKAKSPEDVDKAESSARSFVEADSSARSFIKAEPSEKDFANAESSERNVVSAKPSAVLSLRHHQCHSVRRLDALESHGTGAQRQLWAGGGVQEDCGGEETWTGRTRGCVVEACSACHRAEGCHLFPRTTLTLTILSGKIQFFMHILSFKKSNDKKNCANALTCPRCPPVNFVEFSSSALIPPDDELCESAAMLKYKPGEAAMLEYKPGEVAMFVAHTHECKPGNAAMLEDKPKVTDMREDKPGVTEMREYEPEGGAVKEAKNLDKPQLRHRPFSPAMSMHVGGGGRVDVAVCSLFSIASSAMDEEKDVLGELHIGAPVKHPSPGVLTHSMDGLVSVLHNCGTGDEYDIKACVDAVTIEANTCMIGQLQVGSYSACHVADKVVMTIKHPSPGVPAHSVVTTVKMHGAAVVTKVDMLDNLDAIAKTGTKTEREMAMKVAPLSQVRFRGKKKEPDVSRAKDRGTLPKVQGQRSPFQAKDRGTLSKIEGRGTWSAPRQLETSASLGQCLQSSPKAATCSAEVGDFAVPCLARDKPLEDQELSMVDSTEISLKAAVAIIMGAKAALPVGLYPQWGGKLSPISRGGEVSEAKGVGILSQKGAVLSMGRCPSSSEVKPSWWRGGAGLLASTQGHQAVKARGEEELHWRKPGQPPVVSRNLSVSSPTRGNNKD